MSQSVLNAPIGLLIPLSSELLYSHAHLHMAHGDRHKLEACYSHQHPSSELFHFIFYSRQFNPALSKLRTRADFTALRQVYNPPFCFLRATPVLVWFDCEAPVFHRLHPSSHEVAPSVTFALLVLLQRLKARFPTARG